MRLIAAHIRITLLDLVRSPAYWVPTLLFPTMLYLFFGARIVAPDAAGFALASWSVYAVLGVAFYQFGVGVAQDRESAWDSYLRILPAGSLAPLVAQIAVAILFAIAAVLILWLAAGLAAGIERLLAEPDERQRLGRANRARAMEDFTNARRVERYDMLFATSPGSN